MNKLINQPDFICEWSSIENWLKPGFESTQLDELAWLQKTNSLVKTDRNFEKLFDFGYRWTCQ